jgi:sortase A
MGRRSRGLKFRKRRQRAGFVLFVSFAIVILGGVLFFRLDPLQTTAGETVSRVESPTLADAPEAVAEKEAPAEETAKADDAQDEAQAEKKEVADKEPSGPPIPQSKELWLTVPKLGIYDAYVYDYTGEESSLDYGPAKVPDTGFPWQDNSNTYIAGHRLGWPGTGSDHIFYNLPLLDYGDKIYVTDANGTVYTYEVTDFKEVYPTDVSVTAPIAGREIISLQTCTENIGDYWTMGPNWFARYVVQADRVAIDAA